jgi:hypothetical protein
MQCTSKVCGCFLNLLSKEICKNKFSINLSLFISELERPEIQISTIKFVGTYIFEDNTKLRDSRYKFITSLTEDKINFFFLFVGFEMI